MSIYEFIFVLMVLFSIFGISLILGAIYTYITECVERYHEVKGK